MHVVDHAKKTQSLMTDLSMAVASMRIKAGTNRSGTITEQEVADLVRAHSALSDHLFGHED